MTSCSAGEHNINYSEKSENKSLNKDTKALIAQVLVKYIQQLIRAQTAYSVHIPSKRKEREPGRTMNVENTDDEY